MLGKNKRILILDINKEIVDLVSNVLEDEGYEVRTLESPRLIYNEISLFLPQLIILGFHLKEFDALEICNKIKTSHLYQRIPVLMIAHEQDVKKLVGNEILDGLLQLPIDHNELIAMVSKMQLSK